MIAGNRFFPVFDTDPSTWLNVLNMKESKHRVEIRLKDFDFFTTRRWCIGSLCNNIHIVIHKHRRIQKFVQEHASKGTEETDRGYVDLKKGVEGLSGESVEDFLSDTGECQVSKGETLFGELIADMLLNGAGGGGRFLFRESEIHCRSKSSDVASKGLARFCGAE